MIFEKQLVRVKIFIITSIYIKITMIKLFFKIIQLKSKFYILDFIISKISLDIIKFRI